MTTGTLVYDRWMKLEESPFDVDPKDVTTVEVSGFNREYNRVGGEKDPNELKSGSANVVKDQESSFNALLVPDIGQEHYLNRGYEMMEVRKERIKVIEPEKEEGKRPEDIKKPGSRETTTPSVVTMERNIQSIDTVRLPIDEEPEGDVYPDPQYLYDTIMGASYWGDEFYYEFLLSTDTNMNGPLEEYITDHGFTLPWHR